MILEFIKVSKRYGGVHALQSASLTLRGGEVHALLGGNGSGKSTLIKVASGLVKQDEGQIRLDGKTIDISSPNAAKKLKLVSTAQELSILPNLTVEENLTLCNIPVHAGRFVDRSLMRAKAMDVLARLNIAEDIDTPVSELPINKQYMLEFAKAIYQDFDVLLIDEITSALYRENVETVRSILMEYKKQNKIILFVSHRMAEIFSICDIVTVMRNGMVISTYPMAAANTDLLISDMVGDKKNQGDEEQLLQPPVNNVSHGVELLLSADQIPISSYRKTVSLAINKGEIIGVAGLQGHGQADLVRSLFGLNGSVTVELEGKQVAVSSTQAAVKMGFAYVSGDREKDGSFRQHHLADNIKVVKDIIFHHKVDATEALDRLQVKYDTELQRITTLSGGNQQKVIFGRWIIANPKLLLANDPSKGIDVNARAELRQIIWQLSSQGMAVLFVSSDEDELISLCAPMTNARVIVMYEGGIVKTLRNKEITRDNLIAATLAKGGAGKDD